ncbi:ABC transporter substrate-binding protein [Thalassolituus sp. LLYu03]|uniref:ABC transporter substrate-binding protein n=1 Tax=Thalassolituus sp. LLYu03 TaxID=3421656 RepID=UPI003D2D768E
MRIGTNLWPGYGPLYLARARGYLRPGDVRLVEMPSASDVMDALRLGQLEGGALTLDETLTLLAEGQDLVVILVFDISVGADMILVRDNIQTLGDLASRRIGVETTAVGALMVKSALDMAQLSDDQVKIVHMPLNDHLAAFRAHRIDAAVTFEPYASELRRAGAHVLFDSSAIPGQIVDVLAVRRSALQERRDALSGLLGAYYQARNELHTDPDESLKIINARLQATPEDLPHLFDGLDLPDENANVQLLSGNPSPLERSAQQLADVMLRQKLLPRSLFITGITSVIPAEGAQ